jgi:hypothetical protein
VTQTSTGRPAAAARTAAASPSPVAPATGRLAGYVTGSPGRLRVVAASCALACVAFALLGAGAMRERANALQDARTHAAQVVRLQKAAADLVRADAAVANGFLKGGAEPAAQTEIYDEAIAAASRLLVDAAAAEPADRTELARANALLTDYARQAAHARDANRQNIPLGSGYLVIASQTILRGELLPRLADATAANSAQVAAAFDRSGRARLLFLAAVVVAVAALAAGQLWLARRTHRVVNLGLVAASLAVAVAVGSGLVVLSSTGSAADTVRSTSYAATTALAQARNAAYSAKGLESITLVKQGGGAAYEKQWQEQKAAVDAALSAAQAAKVTGAAAVQPKVAAWLATHRLIRSLDDRGEWLIAVDVATRNEGAATPVAAQGKASNVEFAAVVDAIDPLLDAQAAAVSAELGRPWGVLQGVGWSILVLGVAAAIAAVGGISQRLGEYR